jgi:hypothetical protein
MVNTINTFTNPALLAEYMNMQSEILTVVKQNQANNILKGFKKTNELAKTNKMINEITDLGLFVSEDDVDNLLRYEPVNFYNAATKAMEPKDSDLTKKALEIIAKYNPKQPAAQPTVTVEEEIANAKTEDDLNNLIDDLDVRGIDPTQYVNQINARRAEIQKQVSTPTQTTDWTSLINNSTSERELDKIMDQMDAANEMTPDFLTMISKKRDQFAKPAPTKTLTKAFKDKATKLGIPEENLTELTPEEISAITKVSPTAITDEVKAIVNKYTTETVTKTKELPATFEDLNNEVVIRNGVSGKIVIAGPDTILFETDNIQYEIEGATVFNNPKDYGFEGETITEVNKKQITEKSRYNIENYKIGNVDTVVVNGVTYTVNTNSLGNVESLSPVNKPSQKIKNEKLLIAVEGHRNKLEFNRPSQEEVNSVVEDQLTFNPVLVFLNNVYNENLSDTVQSGLNNLYSDKTLTEQERLQVELWAFDALENILNKKNFQDKEEIKNAIASLETIINLLHEQPQQERVTEQTTVSKPESKPKRTVSKENSKRQKQKVKSKNQLQLFEETTETQPVIEELSFEQFVKGQSVVMTDGSAKMVWKVNKDSVILLPLEDYQTNNPANKDVLTQDNFKEKVKMINSELITEVAAEPVEVNVTPDEVNETKDAVDAAITDDIDDVSDDLGLAKTLTPDQANNQFLDSLNNCNIA